MEHVVAARAAAVALCLLVFSMAAAAQPSRNALPRLSVASPRVDEPEAGRIAVKFVVRLSKSSRKRVTVRYSTADDIVSGLGNAATAGRDYAARGGRLTFKPGQRSQTVSVSVFGDAEPEDDERFLLNLFGARGARLPLDPARATIAVNDLPPPFAVRATLTGSAKGRGTLSATLDAAGEQIAYTVTTSDLESEVAAVHLHPNVPVRSSLIPFDVRTVVRNGTSSGTKEIDRVAVLDIYGDASRYGVHVHTAAGSSSGGDPYILFGTLVRE